MSLLLGGASRRVVLVATFGAMCKAFVESDNRNGPASIVAMSTPEQSTESVGFERGLTEKQPKGPSAATRLPASMLGSAC